jgi:thiol-disulfide isomerase/thioredoxin
MTAFGARRRFTGAAAAALLLAACGRPAQPQERFPRLELAALHGEPGWRGALLVNYWATWCAPCRREMAGLERLSRRAAARFTVVGVCVDEDLNLAREWLRREGVSFANFADPGLRISRQALRIDALPETFLVAADGRLIERARGAREWDSAETAAALERAFAAAS